MCHSSAPRNGTAGFTLIEALVALSIVAIALSSIGALIATTVRGTRAIEAKLARLGAARAVMTALPGRDQLASGNLWGDFAGHTWRIDVSPFATTNISLQSRALWVPQTIVVTVQSPAAAAMQISTVRLRRRDGQ